METSLVEKIYLAWTCAFFCDFITFGQNTSSKFCSMSNFLKNSELNGAFSVWLLFFFIYLCFLFRWCLGGHIAEPIHVWLPTTAPTSLMKVRASYILGFHPPRWSCRTHIKHELSEFIDRLCHVHVQVRSQGIMKMMIIMFVTSSWHMLSIHHTSRPTPSSTTCTHHFRKNIRMVQKSWDSFKTVLEREKSKLRM